jgi:hypothetical protein
MNELQLSELRRQYNIRRDYNKEHDIIKPLWAMYNDKHGVIVDSVRMYDYFYVKVIKYL